MGFKRVTFEGDSHELIDRMNEDSIPSDVVCNIIRACKQEMRQLETWKIIAILREINVVADFLVGKAKNFPKGLHVLKDPPNNLCSLLEFDNVGYPS